MIFNMGKSVLITVGTTGFDDLIEVISSKSFADTLVALGYSRITIQYGSSIRKYCEDYLRQVGVWAGSYIIYTDFNHFIRLL